MKYVRILVFAVLVCTFTLALAQDATPAPTGIEGFWAKWGATVIMPVGYAILVALTYIVPKDSWIFNLIKAIVGGAARPPSSPAA